MKVFHLFLILGLVSLTSACSGGSGSGSGGGDGGGGDQLTTRALTGTISSEQPKALKKAWQKKAARTVTETDPVSCPEADGEITVRAVASTGDPVDGVVADDGTFSLALALDKNYTILFFQGDSQCAQLDLRQSAATAGNVSHSVYTVGAGDENVALGQLTDIGDGHYYAENEADFDSDGDGINDDEDTDADGNGYPDVDCDWDGILDFADSDTSSCGEVGACDVVEIYPTDGDLLWVDGSTYEGTVEVYLNNTINGDGINASDIILLDANGDVFDEFEQPTWDDPTDYFEFALYGLNDLEDYSIEIPAGALTCEDGTSNERDISIAFFAVYDEDVTPSDDDDYDWDYVETGTLNSDDLDDTESEVYYEMFTVDAAEGDYLEALLESDEFDPYLVIYYGDEFIDYNDDFEDGNLNSYLSMFLPYDGEYTIVVTSYDIYETGDFTLSVNVSEE